MFNKCLIFLAVLIFNIPHLLFAQENYNIFINEFLASNVSIDADIVDFDDYSDWIELYNGEDFDVDIGGYFLTDDLNNTTRWEIPSNTILPAKGFLRFWADGFDDKPGHTTTRPYLSQDNEPIYFTTKYYHLNFKLSRAGEQIGLFNIEGILIDSISFGLQLRDVSMGRFPDGGEEWYYFSEPTAGAPNSTKPVTGFDFAEIPTVDLESGFYQGSQFVNIILNSDSSKSTFTLDGSKPFYISDSFETTLTFANNNVLRTRNFENGKLASPVITRSYLVDESISLPVISIVADPKSLWDNKIGIYVNSFKQREIPAHFEYFKSDGSPGFALNAGLRLTGQASLYYAQKSFTIYARDRFGQDEINFQIFPERDLGTFKTLYLRNAGLPDNQSTFFRDALAATLVINKMDIDCQAYSPAVVFINGDYWGIYNIRDKINADYLASIHNINPDNIDLLEYTASPNPIVMEGNSDNYNLLYEYIESHDLSIEVNYQALENWMDIDEYINYQISEIYYDNVIWPEQNMRMWRERKEGKKWRWILFDIDFGLGMPNQLSIGYRNNTLKHATSTKTKDNPPQWSTLIFRKLLKNDAFKTKFIQSFSSYLNTVFHSDTLLSTINHLQSQISSEMPRHINRWRNEPGYGSPIPDYFTWLNNINIMKQFAQYRPEYQRAHIVDYFGLAGESQISLEFSSQNTGSISINHVSSIKEDASQIYFREVPLILEGIPEVGYKFARWAGLPDSLQNPQTIITFEDSMTIEAIFEPIAVNLIPSVISVDKFLALENSPYYAPGSVIVDKNVLLHVEEGVEILMSTGASIVVHGRLLINGTQQKPVTIKSNEFSQNWGALAFVNATDSSIISYLNIIDATKGLDFDRDRAAISGYNSSIALNNVSINKSKAPIFIRYGKVVLSDCYFTSDIAGDLINIKQAASALVENCELRGNNQFDSDAIDYDQIENGIIRGNRIYNFYGFNSDGIDLGEESKNILIENNIIYNIQDKGISIGYGSTATIKRNLIINCDMGIGIKDFDSYGYVEHNTFYGNNYAVACFEKNIGAGGGRAEVVNSIFANNRSASLLEDDQSNIDISYSLSNTDIITGLNNIHADPGFINNLQLATNSVAINKGDPALPADPDGSLPDLGAFPYRSEKQANLIINEIHYNPANGSNYQFIEIVNAGKESIDLDDLHLSGDISFSFPDGNLSPGEYCVVAKNAASYQGRGFKVFQWNEGILEIGAGSIYLQDNLGDLIDFVNYDSKHWWPNETNGLGPSLELHHISLENMASSSWRSSYQAGGSPGKPNNSIIIDGIYINEFVAANSTINQDEFGENDDWIEFYNANPWPVNISGLYITDELNRRSKYIIPFTDSEKTTIPADGHLLFWADGQPEQGLMHLNFKLNKSGDQIGFAQIFEDDTLYIDSLTFDAQITDVSFGRTPDGADIWDFNNNPTPLVGNPVTAIEEQKQIPLYFKLSQNFPNPFNPVTSIKYQISKTSQVELSIFNILGQKVETLVSKKQPAGSYKVEWDASEFASGVFIYRLKAGDFIETKKLIHLK